MASSGTAMTRQQGRRWVGGGGFYGEEFFARNAPDNVHPALDSSLSLLYSSSLLEEEEEEEKKEKEDAVVEEEKNHSAT